MSGTLLEAEALTKHFPVRRGLLGRAAGVVRAVDSVSFTIDTGRTLGLVGESGCGKTTTSRMVLNVESPTSGAIRFDGAPLAGLDRAGRRRYRRAVQAVFQDPHASLDPRMRVGAIVGEPLVINERPDAARLRRRVLELLDLVGLPARAAELFPHEFSGGQRQRIAIARALASEAEFIVCDEPTSALDVSVQAQILNLMRDLQDKFGLTYLFISHNLAVVRHMASRIGVMYLGRIVEIAEGRELFANPRMPYTRMLLGAVPDLAMSGRQRIPVKGEIPNPIDPPSGCAFNPRCPLVFDRCRRETPALINGVACHAINKPAEAAISA
jgi:peptide/nickel transport system ATP-binding protein